MINALSVIMDFVFFDEYNGKPKPPIRRRGINLPELNIPAEPCPREIETLLCAGGCPV